MIQINSKVDTKFKDSQKAIFFISFWYRFDTDLKKDFDIYGKDEFFYKLKKNIWSSALK